MGTLLVKNGTVVTASDEFVADIYAENGKIVEIGKNLTIRADADIMIFDPDYEDVFSVKNSLQGVDYNAYEGMKQSGRVEKVFLRGNLVADCGKYTGIAGTGKFIKAKPFAQAYQLADKNK